MEDKMTLKAARVNANLTIIEASKELKVTPQTLSSWENGKTFPNVDMLPRIENLYNVKYDRINFLNVNHG